MARVLKSAVRLARAEGLNVGFIRPQTLYPFPNEAYAEATKNGAKVLVTEISLGQMVEDVRLAVRKYTDSDFFGYMPGDVPGSDDFVEPILQALQNKN